MLRSLWDETRPTPPPQRWRDWALVGAFVLVALLEGVSQQNLAWRPVAVTVAVALAPLLTHGQPPDIYAVVYMLLFPYSLLRWGSGRDMVLGSAVVAKIGCWLASSTRAWPWGRRLC